MDETVATDIIGKKGFPISSERGGWILAAAILASSMALISAAYSPDRRGKAIGTWAGSGGGRILHDRPCRAHGRTAPG